MKRAVWSFWSKPFLERRSFWRSEKHHLMSWVLSNQLARRHYSETALYTDDVGKEILIDALGLEFGEVLTSLNELAGADPEFWCLGKILTYSLQREPFVHLDSDVFLWNPLPGRMAAADVVAQNPEQTVAGQSCYHPEEFKSAVEYYGGWLPPELAAYEAPDGVHRAFCAGILGGCRVDFIRHYALQALRMVNEPANRPVWLATADRSAANMLVEQYVLAACLDYHRGRADSPYAGIGIECIFRDFGDAFERGDEMGFTHLLGGTKQNPAVLDRVENRVRKDYPEFYDRCEAYWARLASGPRVWEFTQSARACDLPAARIVR